MLDEAKKAEIAPVCKVFLPDLLASFECDRCGECCSVWEIPVDRDAYDRAVAVLGGKATRHLEIADAGSHFGYARLRLIDGRCGFQDGNLCGIHRDYGEEVVFPECRKFPRILFRSPLALHCTASFACARTVESLARPGRVRVLHVLSDSVPFPPELCDTVIEGPPRLCRGKAMTWAAFFALEHGFLEILRERDRSAEHRLLMMIELVRNLAQEDETPLQESAVDRQLQAARVDGFQELSSRFLLAASDADAQISFVLSMLGARLEAGLARGRQLVPIETAVARWSGLSGGERRERYLDDHRRLYMAAGDEMQDILENYLVCRVSGNPDFALRDVQTGLEAVAALLTLIRALAVALAEVSGSPITSRIILDSIRAVDTSFFHLPDFADIVSRRRADPASLLIVVPA